MMTCREATCLHTDFEEGALGGTKLLRYEMHLLICGPCKRFRSQMRTTKSLLERMPKETPSASLVDVLAAQIGKGESDPEAK